MWPDNNVVEVWNGSALAAPRPRLTITIGGHGCPHRSANVGMPCVLSMSRSDQPDLTLLFDGGCPLCVREVRFLRGRDRHQRIAFVDIDAPDYDPMAYADITYRMAMGRIHALKSNGDVLQDIAVFREAYRLIGLGWLYAPTRWPFVAPLANLAYGFWASKRLQWTGRSDLDTLCDDRCAL